MLTFTRLVGACDSLIHPRYPEQKTDSVFLGNVDQPQLGKLWTRETYRFVGTIGVTLILLVSEISEAMTLWIWIRRASLWSLRTEAREMHISIAAFANQAHSYGHSTKVNVLMAMSGEEPPPSQPAPRWLELLWTGGGMQTPISVIRRSNLSDPYIRDRSAGFRGVLQFSGVAESTCQAKLHRGYPAGLAFHIELGQN
jgi:hypothetical protein